MGIYQFENTVSLTKTKSFTLKLSHEAADSKTILLSLTCCGICKQSPDVSPLTLKSFPACEGI